jgi:single-stranded DNA-binding protein
MLGSREGGSSNASYDSGSMDQGGAPDDMNQAPARQAAPQQTAKPQASGGNFDDFEDDIPF